MIDEIWNCRQVNDYSGKNCNKKDFMQSWNHSRTAQHIPIEDLLENGTTIDGEQLYVITDPRGEFESKMISEIHIEEFKNKLTEQDAKAATAISCMNRRCRWIQNRRCGQQAYCKDCWE